MIRDYGKIKELLDFMADLYNSPSFISLDPISVPHRFCRKEDIEIAGFLAATLSWGQRKTIVHNTNKLLAIIDNSPYDFVTGYEEKDLDKLNKFIHRTFNGPDCIFFIESLKNVYLNHGGLEAVFAKHAKPRIKESISGFRDTFFSIPHPLRTKKHISDPMKGSPAKRINLFLRWMVRKDSRGVDFGIWESIAPAQLFCPLDIHSGNVARKLGLITRNQNDWKALEELMVHLRSFDPDDPVKYDFALFGLGIFEKF